MAKEALRRVAADEPQLPPNTLSYFFREATRRLWVSKRTTFVAIAMITIALTTVGAFLLIAENLSRAVAQVEGSSRVNVYLDVAATPDQVAAVDGFLASHADIAKRHFVTRDEALSRFRKHFANLSGVVGELGENPFPPSFEIDVRPDATRNRAFAAEIATLRATPAVDEVQFDWEWIEQLKRVIRVVNVVGLVAGGLLAIAAAFTIANVIRLTMMLYREEIDIMRLVGATERMIRGPFLLEGLLQGTIGGAIAVGLLFVAFIAARRFLAPASSLVWGFLFNTFLPWQKLAALLAGGMLAGFIGSWLSTRESGEETA
jgi:cell division transport system permease protein